VVLGVSPDKPAAQKKFKEKFNFPFPLLADEDKGVAKQFGVLKEKSMYGRKFLGIERTTFVIGADGKINAVISGIKAEKHARPRSQRWKRSRPEEACFMSMLTAGDSKGHHGFSRDYSFLLARSSSDSGSCTGAGCSSNGRAFASANEATDHGSSGCTSTDFDDIALGMALAFTVITGTGNRLAVDGRQTQRELAGCMKASAGLGVSDFASNVTTRSGYRLTVDDDVSGQGSVPGLAGVRRTGADGRTEANGYVCPCGNAGRADQQSRAEQQH